MHFTDCKRLRDIGTVPSLVMLIHFITLFGPAKIYCHRFLGK